MTIHEKTSGGMSGVTVSDSSICQILETGEGLYYRGYGITDLAEHCLYEEVVYLLLYGELPNQNQLDQLKKEMQAMRQLPESMMQALQLIPGDANAMDVLRTAYSLMGSIYPESKHDADWIAKKIIATCPTILCYWQQFHHENSIAEDSNHDTMAEYFIQMLKNGESYTQDQVKLINQSLILYAEHEFNASTFTARVITSTNTDIYSAVCGAIGALRGNLHGGANEAAIKFLLQFESLESVDSKLKEMFDQKQIIMGFGHRVYRESDPRSEILKSSIEPLIRTPKLEKLFDIAKAVENAVHEAKGLCTNVDYYTGLAYHICEIPLNFYTPLFVMGRLSGWVAHIAEQRQENKIIRPNSAYTGPDQRPFIPLDERK